MKEIKIAPSVLSADFSRIGEEVKEITEFGADYIHLDVMDGVFVKNITFGPKFIKNLRPYSKAVFDAHLMIVNPWKYTEKFAESGADIITVHQEACKERLRETLKEIKSFGVKSGVVINPDTPITSIYDVLPEVDMVLLMSVFPGFGGQKFIEPVLDKIQTLCEFMEKNGLDKDVEIDGGVTAENVRIIKEAGANVIVAGSSVFGEKDRRLAIKLLREN